MADGDPVAPGGADDVPEFVVTEEGTLTREEFERRQRAAADVGLGAPEEVRTADLLREERGRVEESTHGDLGGIVDTAIRQGVAGLTFGTSSLLLSAEERERARAQNRVNSTTAALAEIGGGLAPSLLAPGAGLPGSIARLTPAGRVAALTGHVAAKGRGLAGRVVSNAAAGAIEGAAQGVGNFVAREALEENRQFSGESLASAAGMGALLGGVFGGGITVAGEGVKAARRGIARRLAGPGGEAAERAAKEAAELDTAVAKALGGADELELAPLNFGDVASKKMQQEAPAIWGDLVDHVDDQGKRALTAVADDVPLILGGLDDLGVDAAAKVEARDALTRAADNYIEATTDARRWATDAIEAGGVSAPPPSAFDDQGALVLARMDEAANDYTGLAAELRAAVDAGNTAAATIGEAAAMPAIGARVSDAIRSALRGTGGLATAAGALEVARDVGIDVPGLPSVRDIPVVGQALGLFVRMKAGANGLRRVGVLPSTARTRAAATVNTARDRVAQAVGKVAAAATTRTLARKAPALVAREIADIEAQSDELVAERVRATTSEVPEVMQAATQSAIRARNYLMANAPKNPYRAAPFPVQWEPTQDDAQIWQRRTEAVADPLGAVEASMAEPYPDLEAEVLREVYPQIYAVARNGLLDRAPELVKELPDHRLQALGRAYRVPLAINQLPNYPRPGTSVQPSPPPQPTDVARGPGPTTSPAVTTELTGDAARARQLV